MQIEAGGKTWIVEERELASGLSHGSQRFFGVSFRNAEYDSDILQVRWVMKPDVLTPRIARDLFDIAGIRTWTDPRDGHEYRLHLETRPPAAADSSQRALETLRFQSQEGTAETPWTLAKPLGFASDQELTRLLDRARSS